MFKANTNGPDKIIKFPTIPSRKIRNFVEFFSRPAVYYVPITLLKETIGKSWISRRHITYVDSLNI